MGPLGPCAAGVCLGGWHGGAGAGGGAAATSLVVAPWPLALHSGALAPSLGCGAFCCFGRSSQLAAAGTRPGLALGGWAQGAIWHWWAGSGGAAALLLGSCCRVAAGPGCAELDLVLTTSFISRLLNIATGARMKRLASSQCWKRRVLCLQQLLAWLQAQYLCNWRTIARGAARCSCRARLVFHGSASCERAVLGL
jgi:hypothetical protein